MKAKTAFLTLSLILLPLFLFSSCSYIPKQKAEKRKVRKFKKANEKRVAFSKPEAIFHKKLNQLEITPMVVEVYVDEKKEGTWAQEENNWRFEDPEGKSIAIYRGKEDIFYLVDLEEKTALKIEKGAEKYREDYQVFNPLTLIKTYQNLTFKLSEGKLVAKEGDIKITIFFKGPHGLVSEIKIDKESGSQKIEFKYLKVGDVSDYLFKPPQGVKVFPSP